MLQRGTARDLLTRDDGTAEVLAVASTEATVDYADGRKVRTITTVPDITGTGALVGQPAATGFREVVKANVGTPPGSLLYLLLDEIPAACLVAGYALQNAVARGVAEYPPGLLMIRDQVVDMCAGFEAGGTIISGIETTGHSPVVTGPEAPRMDEPSDPLGWHDLDALDVDSMRRARRIDVWHDEDRIRLDVFFRDSHVGPGRRETVIHEYGVEVSVDPSSLTVTSCVADGHVLPWTECPAAVASASRLVGLPVGGLRTRVRSDFLGLGTCTHLNDVLRGLEDTEPLLDLLARSDP